MATSESTQVNLNVTELKTFLTHIVNNNQFLQETGKKPVATEIVGDSGVGKTSAALQLANELGLNFVKLNLAQIEELGDLVGFPVRQFQLCKNTVTVPVLSAAVRKTVTKSRMVPKTELQPVHGFETKVIKKQVLRGGKLVTEDVEQKVPVITQQEVTVDVEEFYEEEEEVVAESASTTTTGTDCLWIDEQAVDEYVRHGYSFTGNKRMSYCPPEWIADRKGGGILILDDWNRADVRFIQAVMELN